MMKAITVDPQEDTIRISFFDTSGEEKYHAITACHYRKAAGALIVYDVTNR
jgi:GTPase SAR1 family protein